MSRPEAMLLSQAHTLDALFNSLAQKAFMQTHMPHYESFLRLAFKAQGQCRSTLQTLSDIKKPVETRVRYDVSFLCLDNSGIFRGVVEVTLLAHGPLSCL